MCNIKKSKCFGDQHCAFKIRWGFIIIPGIIIASVAMLLKIPIQANWVAAYSIAVGAGGAIDYGLYRVKKNGHNENRKD